MIRLINWLLSQPLLWAALGIVFGPIAFLRGFRLLQRKQLTVDTPRSTIRGAALGAVEVSGKVAGPYTLVSPLSQTDCLYYRVVVESKPAGDPANKMRELCAPFFLDDGTGTVMIYPAGCELDLQPSIDRSEFGSAGVTLKGFSTGDSEFAEEYCLKPGDEIFVRGTLRENPWASKSAAAESSEFSRIGPGFVSAAEADILRRKYYPVLDPNLPSGSDIAPDADFDLYPPVILMKGDGPFVISTHSEAEIAAKLRWKSILYIWGGPAVTIWALWEIIKHAKAAGLLPGNS
jgi:hypothetical protein